MGAQLLRVLVGRRPPCIGRSPARRPLLLRHYSSKFSSVFEDNECGRVACGGNNSQLSLLFHHLVNSYSSSVRTGAQTLVSLLHWREVYIKYRKLRYQVLLVHNRELSYQHALHQHYVNANEACSEGFNNMP